jgi:hypothetical protein
VASRYVVVVTHEKKPAIGRPNVASLNMGVDALDFVANEERNAPEERSNSAGVCGRGVAAKCDKAAVDRTRPAELAKARLKTASPATGNGQGSDEGKRSEARYGNRPHVRGSAT